ASRRRRSRLRAWWPWWSRSWPPHYASGAARRSRRFEAAGREPIEVLVGHRAGGLGAELGDERVTPGRIDAARRQRAGAALDVRVGQVEDLGAERGPLPRHRVAVLDGLGAGRAQVVHAPRRGGDEILVEELGDEDRLRVAFGEVLARLAAGVVPGVRIGAAGVRAALRQLALHVREDLIPDRDVDAPIGGDALPPRLAQPRRDGLALFLAPPDG